MEKKKEKGSLTVEAAVFLVLFLAAFLTLLNFARLTRAQTVMQHAINGTAMQISQYGYLLTKTGMAAAMGQCADDAKVTRSNISEITSAVSGLSGAVQNLGNGISEETVTGLVDAIQDADAAADIARGYFNNPEGLLTGLAAVGKSDLENAVCTAVVSKMAEGQLEAYLEELVDDPDAYLEEIGIVGGMDGLDFGDSALILEGGKKDINITVRFKVKNQMFPFLDFGEHEMCLNASTRLW